MVSSGPEKAGPGERFESPRELAYKIEQETLQIESLKSSLKLTNELSLRSAHTLSSFDSRLAKLESSILPIHDATQKLTRLNENIGATIGSLTSIIEHLDKATSEEQAILAGPKAKGIRAYIEAVGRLRAANGFLRRTKLNVFQKHQSQIAQVLKAAHQHLIHWFRTQLENCSVPIEADASFEQKVDAKHIDRLVDIMKHIQLTEADLNLALPNSHLDNISHIRANFLLNSLAPAAKRASPSNKDQFVGSTYQKGSSPLIDYTQKMLKLFEAEHEFQSRLISDKDLVNIFGQTIGPAFQAYVDAGEALINYAKKDLHNEIFLLFDILENLLEHTPQIKALLKLADRPDSSILAMVSTISSTLMKSFPAFLEDIRSGAHRQSPLSPDGTVHEMTSGALNFVKRILDYPSTAEMTLQNLGVSHSCLQNDFIREGPLAVRYFTNVAEALIAFCEVKSRGYKNKTLSAIFQLNNCHYLLKAIQTSPVLAKYVHDDTVAKLDKLISQHLDVYHESWKVCFECLTDTSLTRVALGSTNKTNLSSSEKSNVKEKLKAFNMAFEELHRTQKAYTISDQELRKRIIDQVLKILLPIYNQSVERFRHSDFSKTPSKYIKYDRESLSYAVNGLFDLAS
ncbi:exocyst complex component exo70 [Entomophthora muscae]|uniref:Exocyst complex component exo70 n=2 Tax=Entomophthora muscae TaxID=34485 RepID=A0ACC2UDJ9_9FUNG|nr:exocyst complex component exo70 [Entomophthora muscae]KAJ9085135.1 exocyst complex component exo70 [Entomophthora muscae]